MPSRLKSHGTTAKNTHTKFQVLCPRTGGYSFESAVLKGLRHSAKKQIVAPTIRTLLGSHI